MMNSNLLTSLPKYIFQSEHERLTSVKNILNDLKEQQARESANNAGADELLNGGEVSEYPIEHIENQAHVIHRHLNIKFVMILLFYYTLFFS